MQVWVCTWNPEHTLARVEVQYRALKNGAVAMLVDRHGAGTPELQSAMLQYKIASYTTSANGDRRCAECEALMDEVLSSDGIESRLEAVRDVAQGFDKAVERTRRQRLENA